MTEIAGIDYPRQYGRDDVEYDTFYSDWSKRLAKLMTRSRIIRELGITDRRTSKAAHIHHRVIEKSSSMGSNSQGRAQARNVVAAEGEYSLALSGALEIHDLFPEYAKDDG